MQIFRYNDCNLYAAGNTASITFGKCALNKNIQAGNIKPGEEMLVYGYELVFDLPEQCKLVSLGMIV